MVSLTQVIRCSTVPICILVFISLLLLSWTALWPTVNLRVADPPRVVGHRAAVINPSAGCYVYDEMEQGDFRLLGSAERRLRGCRRRLPDAIVIGVKKAGTSALKEFLRYHPRIAFAYNESHFFSPRAGRYNPDLGPYRGAMAYSTPGQVTMEKTPMYFHDPEAPGRIWRALPSAKLVLIVRDPVQRAVSDYLQLSNLSNKPQTRRQTKSFQVSIGVGAGYIMRKTFEESVTRQDGTLRRNNYILLKGRYAYFWRRWMGYFPREQILVLDGDKFVKNPLLALKAVEEFLHIEPFFTSDHLKFNEKKNFFCLEKPLPNNCLPMDTGRPHPIIKDGVLRKLKRYYAPYNAEFLKLVNVTFEW